MHSKPVTSLIAALILSFALISNAGAFSFGGPPKIDSTSDASMKKSMEKVKESLPEAKRQLFMDAVQTLMFKDIGNLMQLAKADSDKMKKDMMAALNGKTADEIISEAALIKQEAEEKKRQAALAEIKELEARKQRAEAAKLELIKFKVISSSFYKQENEYGIKQPVIKLTVLNGMEVPISRAYFSAALKSPDRAVPWLEEDFNYQIPGGIEPGEKLSWSLAPNKFGKWGQVDAPKDAILTLQVTQLDDPNGTPLGAAEQFTEKDQRRLKTLTAQYK